MSQRLFVVVGMAITLVGCDRAARIEKAHEVVKQAYEAAETPQDKVAAVRGFLESYPESAYTLRTVRQAAYQLSYKLEQPAEADALVVEILAKVKDQDLRRDLMKVRVSPLGKLGEAEKLAALAVEIGALKPLGFGENESFIEAATEAEAWAVVVERAGAAVPQCSVEAFRAENPERKMSDEEIARRVQGQLAWTLAAKGWALANLDRPDEALATFTEAETHDLGAFTDDSDSLVGAYKGRTLVRLGRYQEAVPVLAPYAIFGHDEGALAALLEAHAAAGGSDESFEEFLWQTRLELAPDMVDFTLAGYEGTPHAFSELSTGQVTLLSFWFPT